MQLHAEPKLAAQERMVDDASGEVQVQRNTHKHMHTTMLKRFICKCLLFVLFNINNSCTI